MALGAHEPREWVDSAKANDEAVGVPVVVFTFWRLGADHPEFELREIPTPQNLATSPALYRPMTSSGLDLRSLTKREAL